MAGSPGSELDSEFATIVYHLVAAKYFMLASFIFMVYDHIITFAEEVDCIWQREWTGATWLFALNRYLTELQFIVNLVSFHNPHWTGKVCAHGPQLNGCVDFIPFAGASTLVSIAIAEIILILRTYALYQRNKYILGLLAFFWTGQMIVMGTTMRHPTRVELPEGLVGCIQGGNGSYAAAFWLAPLATDSIIFGLTMFRSLQYIYKARYRVPLIHVIVRDGVLYFTVILSANLLNCLLYYLAPPSLKVIGASFSQIITVAMLSRLQLNLRSESVCSTPRTPTSQLPPISSPEFPEKEKRLSGTISSLSHYFEATVTDLGKDVITTCDEEDKRELVTDEAELHSKGRAMCLCSIPKCLCRAFGGEPPVELEMGPIRPVSGGVTMLDTRFTPEESAYLDQVIRISPAIVEERRPSDGF
ncbi:unnamed protein product [Rhizoctonia solani]|uniref:DUF6533 domain-containing protein n=1 Tax=Rhizoctonia solani TaxID=456999 RepID=A0A8H3HJ64_9AGAM|nr:unnamed protein product [Rhizoctonia solani]